MIEYNIVRNDDGNYLIAELYRDENTEVYNWSGEYLPDVFRSVDDLRNDFMERLEALDNAVWDAKTRKFE